MKTKKPTRIVLGQDTYETVVLLVQGQDNLGRPRECRMLHDDESVHLKGGEQFLIVYANAKAIRATKN